MNLVWNIVEDDNVIKVQLIYNIYFGIKKLYIDNKEKFKLRSFRQFNKVNFEHNGKEYKLELIPDAFGYKGYVITPDGERIPNITEKKVYYKTPMWVIPFAIINFIIPIFSVEALRPWLIAVLASYVTVRISKKPTLTVKKKLIISACISILAWAVYYLFYISVKHLGFNGGFLSF